MSELYFSCVRLFFKPSANNERMDQWTNGPNERTSEWTDRMDRMERSDVKRANGTTRMEWTTLPAPVNSFFFTATSPPSAPPAEEDPVPPPPPLPRVSSPRRISELAASNPLTYARSRRQGRRRLNE